MSSNAAQPDKNLGFTLIEMLVVMAIIGILAMVVYPSYVNTGLKTYRTEAQRELVRIANLQEQYFADQRRFDTDLTKLGLSTSPFYTETNRFQITAVAITTIDIDFELRAQAVNGQQADAKCAVFTLNYLGEKGAASADGVNTTDECWNR
jgi:type IV pilus assembly protein PilE